MQITEMLRLIGARLCACGKPKEQRKLCCGACWLSLPSFVQKPLARLYGEAVRVYVKKDKWSLPDKLGDTGEQFFCLYEAAIDWFTWTPERAWANAKFYTADGREF